MKRERFLVILGLLLSIMLLAACSNSSEPGSSNNTDNTSENHSSDDGNNAEDDPKEDITMRFWYPGEPEEVEKRLKEVFPHITFEWENIQVVNAYKETIEEEISKQKLPDIMVLTDYSLSILKGYEMLFDLTSLIEKHQLDMSDWPEYRIKAMHAHKPDDDGIYSLPGQLTYHGLAYNKDVFDKFSVPYPTDDMTWEEVIDLARKVTGERDGTQYRGLDIALDPQMVGMLDDWLVDADDEVHFENREDVKKVLSLIEEVASIPGNIPDNGKEDFFDPWSYGIYNERNVAMALHARYIAQGLAESAEESDINFDFVSWPLLDENNPTQPYTDGTFYAISPYSEYPDEAFKAIEYLISDEWIQNTDPLDYNMDILKDKNMEAFTRHPLNVPENRASEHQVTGRWLFGKSANRIIYEGVDINTAIREAQEEAETLIKEAKGSD
ncbi:hypothetical protein J14TS2_12410 [Bacillus sp. J14TS2]|uniref:ABC transporter substrate-binding protein n=1 Tax=Bacillus sp. J14TS2 TaxID=2807188 RepID=UPI001B2E3799|nr:extracellular solute-binding protein [Bacillus sp. J14TS2]GIN70766.1 hypothetical protein J14TS2_12410 [Bacillus sp. J14TS2]